MSRRLFHQIIKPSSVCFNKITECSARTLIMTLRPAGQLGLNQRSRINAVKGMMDITVRRIALLTPMLFLKTPIAIPLGKAVNVLDSTEHIQEAIQIRDEQMVRSEDSIRPEPSRRHDHCHEGCFHNRRHSRRENHPWVSNDITSPRQWVRCRFSLTRQSNIHCYRPG